MGGLNSGMNVSRGSKTGIAILAGAVIILAIALAGPARGATANPGADLSGSFYIDNSANSHCSDAPTSGHSPSDPWCDFVNLDGQTFAPGAHILLRSGDTFHAELGKLYGSGTSPQQIVLGAYGAGDRPLIQGSGLATDRGIWIQDASYWTVQNLQISDVGAGLVFWYSSNGHHGLTIQNIYTENVQGVFAGSPPQADLPGMYHSAGILITGSVPVTKDETAVSGVYLSGLEGYNNDDDVDISGFNANSGGQQGFLSTALGDHSVSDVTLTNAYFHRALSGENFDNLNDMTITGMRLEDTGYGANHPSGTTALFFWSSSNVSVCDSILTGEQNTGSPDQTETDLEAFDHNIRFLGDYYGGSAGGGIEILEINGYTGNYQSGHEIADSAFAGTGDDAFYSETPSTPNDFSGTASANLYDPGESLSSVGYGGPSEVLPGWTYQDNDPATSGAIHNAGEDFSSVQGGSGWSEQYLAGSAGQCPPGPAGAGDVWTDLPTYDATNDQWEGDGTASATAMRPAAGANCAVDRAWTAPADGTISIRGRITPEATPGGAAGQDTARITVNGLQVWPAAGGGQTVGSASAGYDANVNLYVQAGDVVRFELADDQGAAIPVGWMPSIGYTAPGPLQVNDGDSSVSYSQGWTDQGGLAGYLDGDAHYSDTPGNNAMVTFTGTGISWYGAKSPDHGQADVAVCDAAGANCGPATTVDTYAPTTTPQQDLYTVSGLPYGTHTLQITVTGGSAGEGNYVDIDYFAETGTEIDDTNSAVTYSPGWTAQSGLAGYYDSDSHLSSHAGATAEVTFTGTGITWIGSTADRGRAQVQVCEAGAQNCSQPQIVTPYDPLSDTQQPLYSVGGLSYGTHVLIITVLPGGRGHSVDLDAFAIDESAQADDADPTVSYSAGWTDTFKAGYYDADAHFTATAGATATFTFTGTGATWIGGEATDHGRADVSVCNAAGTNCGAPTMVDTYCAVTLAQQNLYSVSGLPYGTHTLKITARADSSGTGHYTDIDAFAVSG
jgi:hypothetical protein